MIVADTNLLFYLTISSDLTAAAESLYRKDDRWAAPILWRSEFCNALALYLRKSLLTLDKAIGAYFYAKGVIAENEYEVDAAEVLRLAATSGETAYDCEFVALALRLGVPLITADKK